jgi:hypothetical protein
MPVLQILLASLDGRRLCCFSEGACRFLVSFLRILVRLGCEFHRLFGILVSRTVIFLAVMRGSNAVGVRGEVVVLGGSLVPVVSALPAMISSIASVAHERLLNEI